MDAGKIIKVRRANVILDIPSEQKAEYMAQGFDVIDKDGKVVEYTVPSDVNVLKKAYTDHINEIKALKAKLANGEAGGGVPQEDYDNLLDDYNALQDENEALKARVEELEAEIEASAKKKTTKK